MTRKKTQTHCNPVSQSDDARAARGSGERQGDIETLRSYIVRGRKRGRIKAALDALEQIEQDTALLHAQVAGLKQAITIASADNHRRNMELDALHYVWCSGGCEGGTHRFGEHPPLTQEIIEAAISNTRRLVRYFENAEHRKLPNSEIKARWEEEQKLRAGLENARQDMVLLDCLERLVFNGDITISLSPSGHYVQMSYRDDGTHSCGEHGENLRAVIKSAIHSQRGPAHAPDGAGASDEKAAE